MSDEQVVTNEPEEVTDTLNENDKPAGYAPVDIESASPEEIKQRIDYLFRQVKDGQREKSEYRRLVEDQGRKLDELTNGFGQVVDHLSNKSYGTQESQLRAEMQQKFEAGDTQGYLAAQEKLIEIKSEKKAQKNAPKPQPKQTQVQEESVITPDEERYVDAWQQESVGGQTIRPWAQENHPDFPVAFAETQAVFTSPRYANMTIQQKMSEIDRRMGLKNPTGGQTVMGGNLTGRSKGQKLVLSDRAREIAVKTKFAGPKASDAEHIEKYRKQLEQVKKGQR